MPGPDAVFAALKARNLAALRKLLDADPALARARSPEGVSALVTALYLRFGEAAKLLAERAKPIDFWDAAALGDASRVEALLRDEPGLAASHSPDGWTAMHYVGFFGHRALGEVLVKHGATPRGVGKNYMSNTPLHSAAAAGQHALVPWLVEHGAEVDARDSGGHTPLMVAAGNGFSRVVEALLAAGASVGAVNKDGKTALALAVESDEEEVVALLRKHGARS